MREYLALKIILKHQLANTINAWCYFANEKSGEKETLAKVMLEWALLVGTPGHRCLVIRVMGWGESKEENLNFWGV